VGEEPDLPPPPEPEVVEPPPPVLKRNLLERLLWEVTENGLWKKLFNEQMSMEEFELASVQWMEQNDDAWDSALGYYMPNSNEIVLRPSKDRDQLMGTLIHELTHNWQFQSGKFDTQRWMFSSEAQQYYAGSGQSLLVVEGHARFADQMYIFHRGIQSRYKSLNSSDWNEYKVGYLLILGIHQAFGEEGLYRWLRGDTGEPMLRSRNPDLKWGFSLTDALETFGLLYEARTQRFNGIDIKVDQAEQELVAQSATAK
jgi:hypothetical protein